MPGKRTILLLALGPTPGRAKEAYELHFHPDSHSGVSQASERKCTSTCTATGSRASLSLCPNDVPSACSPQQQSASQVRAALRALVVGMSEAEDASFEVATKLHMMYALESSHAPPGPPPRCPDGFVPREGFRLRMRKGSFYVLDIAAGNSTRAIDGVALASLGPGEWNDLSIRRPPGTASNLRAPWASCCLSTVGRSAFFRAVAWPQKSQNDI